jgi:putative oxidoreductase
MDEYNLALLIIRVALGLTMAAHGYNKFFKGGKIAGTASWFDGMGMRPGKVHATAAASGEILSGLFLAAGLLTSFAALGFVALMSVAHWTVHRHNGFMILKEGWEYVFVLAASAVTISMLGPLEWSLDNAIGWDDDLDGYTGLIISAGGGTLAATFFLAAFFRPPATRSP